MNHEHCRCDDDDDRENVCADCENPLGPYNFTGVCKSCQKERDREKADAAADEAMRRIDAAVGNLWSKP